MPGLGPNRNKFRLQLPWMKLNAKTIEELNKQLYDNNREHDRAYPESLINLDVGAKVRAVGAEFAVATGTFSTHGYNVEVENEYGFFDATISTQRLIVPRGLAGRYEIRTISRLANNSAAGFSCWIRYYPLNHPTNFYTIAFPFPGSGTTVSAFGVSETTVPYFLNEGDAISAGLYHEAGANRNFLATDELVTDIDPAALQLEMWRIGVRG